MRCIACLFAGVIIGGGTSPVEGGHSLYPPGAPGQGSMRSAKEIMLALLEKLPCQGSGESVLPATGQTKCCDAVKNEIVNCTSADCPGRDGFYQAGCPTTGRFVDDGDGTVSDLCTGLLWQKTPGSSISCRAACTTPPRTAAP
jgi:hypothetical protein